MLRSLPAALLSVLAALACGPLTAATPRAAGENELPLDRLRPHWELGDRWTVETVSRPLHVRADANQTAHSSPIQWQFEVPALEEAAFEDCFRVEVICQAADRSIPKAIFWLDRDSFALRRITTHLPVPGGFQEMTMSYDSGSGQPAPILGPLSALPIDTPVLYAGAKGLQTFIYTSHFGSAERKELGDVGFAQQIEQQVSEVPQDEVQKLFGQHFAKSLVDDSFTKSLSSRPVTEVRLKSQGRVVRQLWQAERPWPIYCDNGYTVSRLVAVEQWEDRP